LGPRGTSLRGGSGKDYITRSFMICASSPNIIWLIKLRRMRWAGHVAHMGNRGIAYIILVGRSEGKRPLGRPRCRWEVNSKMDLQERDGLIWFRIGKGGGLM